jgi:hypothetical protein
MILQLNPTKGFLHLLGDAEAFFIIIQTQFGYAEWKVV